MYDAALIHLEAIKNFRFEFREHLFDHRSKSAVLQMHDVPAIEMVTHGSRKHDKRSATIIGCLGQQSEQVQGLGL
jgi:hypothetical protein